MKKTFFYLISRFSYFKFQYHFSFTLFSIIALIISQSNAGVSLSGKYAKHSSTIQNIQPLSSVDVSKLESIKCGDEIGVIQNRYQINFGDTINTGISSEEKLAITWSVFPATGLNVSSGSTKMTGNLIFTHPGEYQIKFNIPAHGEHPAKVELVQVEVSAVRMNFDVNNVVFSKALTMGDATGVTMTVPILVKTFDGKSIAYSSRESKTTGAANISSRLIVDKPILENGQNELKFILSGPITKPGNVQFRFYGLDGQATFFNYQITH